MTGAFNFSYYITSWYLGLRPAQSPSNVLVATVIGRNMQRHLQQEFTVLPELIEVKSVG